MKQKKIKQYPIFVYGTLMEGQPNFMYGFGRYGDKVKVGEATLTGHVLCVPHAYAKFPYLCEAEALPADRRDGEFGRVKGQLMTVDPSVWDDCIERLNDLEGVHAGHYSIKLVEVDVVGVKFKAWTYYLAAEHVPSLFFDPVISGNDWIKYLYERGVR